MDSFDYVIVGAGTAGCVLANRLSADPANNVLLLEAGGSDRRFWVRIPIGYARTFRDPAVNWMYQSQPEPALDGRCSYWPRGKLLGGSSSINAMAYVRGLPRDYDDWERQGNVGWGWRQVEPLFRLSEDHAAGASRHHGAGGPLRVTDITRQVHPLCHGFIEAARAAGLGVTQDFNGASARGVGVYQINTRNGLRESASTAFLRPVRGRANLTLHQHAHAEGLVLHQQRAAGVAYRHGGRLVQAQARREVIVCAGAINSPQLLLLSGIGDPVALERLGIRLACPLPMVGRGLQDHLHVTHHYRSRVPTLNQELGSWANRVRAGLRFVLRRDGPLSMSVNQAGGFVRSDAAHDDPDLQLYFNPASYTTRAAAAKTTMNPDPFAGFSMSVNACRPTSRGSVMLQSRDPFQAPLISPNYLSTEHDVAQALAGARLLRRLAATPPLSALIESEILPGPGQQTDAQLLADFRARADTIFHPVGSCRMGPDARDAVVDSRLRVHGIEGLRVVDASVFPAIPSGNTGAPTIMVAEKAAQMILQDALGLAA